MTNNENDRLTSSVKALAGPYLFFLFGYMMLYEFFDTYTTSYYSIMLITVPFLVIRFLPETRGLEIVDTNHE